MYNQEKLFPKIFILVFFGSLIVGGISAISYLAVTNRWSFSEIAMWSGVLVLLAGSLSMYGAFAGGTRPSNKYLGAMSPEMAKVDNDYGFARRSAFPIISVVVFLIGVIFALIGLFGSGILES